MSSRLLFGIMIGLAALVVLGCALLMMKVVQGEREAPPTAPAEAVEAPATQ